MRTVQQRTVKHNQSVSSQEGQKDSCCAPHALSRSKHNVTAQHVLDAAGDHSCLVVQAAVAMLVEQRQAGRRCNRCKLTVAVACNLLGTAGRAMRWGQTVQHSGTAVAGAADGAQLPFPT